MDQALNVLTETSTVAPPPVASPIDDLMYHAALLAGMGAAARKTADDLNSALCTSAGNERTCIDAGSALLFSLLAPGPRSLRVLVRRGPDRGDCQSWLRAHYLPDREAEHWHILTYMGETATAWENARSAAERIGALDRLQQTHAILGPYSRLYSVSWTAHATASRAWVGWQLDRSLPIDKALSLLGIDHAWPAAAAFWEDLLGTPPHPRFGPWSISLGLGGEHRLRVGSTNWSRQVEDQQKRRRMATVIEHQGGDRRFAESLYKLVQGSAQPGRVHAVGRAVELEFFKDRPMQAEFYIRVP